LDWAALKADSVVVDVGGGSGNVTMHLAKVFPHLKYVVQDLKSVITDTAEKVSPIHFVAIYTICGD
jgi:ubiquinone/menaquinone biosynthesis C-methylase UbiE